MNPAKVYSILFLTTLFALNSTSAREDFFAKISGEPKISLETPAWFRISLPFSLLNHPSQVALAGRKPQNLEQAFNPDFVDNFKIRFFVCFSNNFNKKVFRSNNYQEANFYEYYGSEVEFSTIKIQRAAQYVNFLFPTSIAERNEYGRNNLEPVGYAVEFYIDGAPLEISNSIYFGRYREEETLAKFKQMAMDNSSKNKGILIPAHYIFPNLVPPGSHFKNANGGR